LLEPYVQDVIDRLLSNVGGDGFDLVADFAVPLPGIVIAEMLGVPRDDRSDCKRWTDAIVRATN
jgi:cytochrome P450